jgi:hypothetical protein
MRGALVSIGMRYALWSARAELAKRRFSARNNRNVTQRSNDAKKRKLEKN